MDLKKTGAFIARRRREKGLTQNQLAAHLGVTDKAVSRWETGRGFPDPATLPALAEALGVTIAELVNGEAAAIAETRESAEEAVLAALQYAGGMRRKTFGAVLLAVGLLCSVYSLMLVGVSTLPLSVFGAALALGGMWLLWAKQPVKLPQFLSPKVARFGALLFLAGAFALEWLPNGIVMRWATPPGEPAHVSYCAYFSLLPFGYGNVFPLLTAVATALLLAFWLILLLRKKRSGKLFVGGVLALLFSVAPALLGLSTLTLTGWGITACLVASLVLLSFGDRADDISA